MEPIVGNYYLIKFKSPIDHSNYGYRIARFNGFGDNQGWGGQDWSGDSGHSSDSWMHDEIDNFISLDSFELEVLIKGYRKKRLNNY